MNVESHLLECQHPFGDGIHVLVLENPDIIHTIFVKMGINDQLFQEYEALKQLAGHDKAASKCGVYIGNPPPTMVSCIAVVKMVVKPENEYESQVILLLVEEGYQPLAMQVAEQMRIALHKL
jgi:hypothetical protein